MEEKYVALVLEKSGNEVVPEILQSLRDSKLSELCYAYKLRVKTQTKIIEKKSRKTIEKPEYTLKNITDVVGLRLVTLFKGEMIDVLGGVLSVITHKNGINPNPFLSAPPEEIIIYSSNPSDDLNLTLKKKILEHCSSASVDVKYSKEGYSSIHIVCRLRRETETLDSTLPGYKLPLEIQIRTVFEDAWGEIDHKYGYVIRSGKEIGTPINNPEYVLSHLKVLKKFSDACVDYAECIRLEATTAPSLTVASSTVISVDSDDALLARMAELGVCAELIDAYVQARNLKDGATSIRHNDLAGSDDSFLNSAELFKEIAGKIEVERRFNELDPGEKLILYYSKMNEAVCLMSLNIRDHAVVAQHIYKQLEEHYPDYPLLKMRAGQAYGRLGYVDLAISKIREAGVLTDQILQQIKNSDGEIIWTDNLPKVDYEHLRKAQPKVLGYHLWLQIRETPADQFLKKAELFREAYAVTEGCLAYLGATGEDALSIRNNLVYYGIGYLAHAGLPVGSVPAKTMRSNVESHLNYIEKYVIDYDKLPLDILDTLTKAYSFLGRIENARRIASLVMNKCLASDKTPISSDEKVGLLQTAYTVLQDVCIKAID